MRQFVQAEDKASAEKHIKEEAVCVYELKGVLLHKGTSAYHGHYEAQVWDATCVSLAYPLDPSLIPCGIL